MDAHVVELGPRANPPPGFLDVGEMRAGVLACDDPGVVLHHVLGHDPIEPR